MAFNCILAVEYFFKIAVSSLLYVSLQRTQVLQQPLLLRFLVPLQSTTAPVLVSLQV